MTNCPKCGKQVDPTKNYKITVGPVLTDDRKEITFGMCQDCALVLILNLQKSK
jgi:hypothetical protein